MTLRRLPVYAFVVLLAASSPVSAANFTTANFVVTAPDQELARRFGEQAERFRREKALEWLGQEMPPWPRRCPLDVRIGQNGAGGATEFSFGGDANRPIVTSQRMEIHGPVRQLLDSVLPHEITHTVFAYHFGRPVPRWADEGGSVLSENDKERFDHDLKCREYLNLGRGIRLRALLRMTEYPNDMHVLYAQGYSVSAYLVEKGGSGTPGRVKLLQFLGLGMQGNDPRSHGTVESWDNALKRVYGIENVDSLEAEWLSAMHNQQGRVSARNGIAGTVTPTSGKTTGTFAAGRSEIRSSAAPVLPILEPPIRSVRGAMPENEPIRNNPARRPAALPDHPPPILLPPEAPGPGGR